jgi:hypothetical protein
MPKRVVYLLEPIQVEEYYRYLIALPFGVPYGLAETVQQQAAVGKAGQLVTIREPACFRRLSCQQDHCSAQKRISSLEVIDLLQRCR